MNKQAVIILSILLSILVILAIIMIVTFFRRIKNDIDLVKYKKNKLRAINLQLELEKDDLTRQVILESIENRSQEIVNNSSINVIKLPSESYKQKIIGKKGKTINHFKQKTHTETLVEIQENFVTISCNNPLDRQIAVNTMQHMIDHEAFDLLAIDNIYKKEFNLIQKKINQIGKEYIEDKLKFNVNKQLYSYVGRLMYRTSYSQNVLQHCYECAMIAKEIAIKLHFDDPNLACMCGFFHDIGKASDYENDYNHIENGVKIAIKYNLPKKVIEVIGNHHKKNYNDDYVRLIKIADKISAGRRGARTSTSEDFDLRQVISNILSKYGKKIRHFDLVSSKPPLIKLIIYLNKQNLSESNSLEFDIQQALSKNVYILKNNYTIELMLY